MLCHYDSNGANYSIFEDIFYSLVLEVLFLSKSVFSLVDGSLYETERSKLGSFNQISLRQMGIRA